jgi:Flp pilus assembly protein TadG
MRARRLGRDQRGTALVETALTLPLMLLISVGIFEFGRAYQTWQILTNAAREGARIAILPGTSDDAIEARVRDYLTDGAVDRPADADVDITRNNVVPSGGGTASASRVTVSYPYEFMVLQPVATLVVSDSNVGAPLTMTATALMRNE